MANHERNDERNEQRSFRYGLLDFQVGEEHDRIALDPDEYVKTSAAAHVEEVVFIAKDAYGNAYYDSLLVQRNARIAGDYIQGAIAAGKKYGVGIHAYYNVLLDDKVAAQFPHYRMVNPAGEPIIAFDYYKILCPNSPYFDIVAARLEELVRNYDLKGIFFDITYFVGPTCFCSYCRARFEQEYGYALPVNAARGTRELRDWHAFRRKSRFDLIYALKQKLLALKPDLAVSWNGSGSYHLGEREIDRHAAILTTEFHAPEFLDGIIRTKWMQSAGKPFHLTVPFELGSWGDWTVNPLVTMQAVAATVTANGGGVCINHVPYPSGEFASAANADVVRLIQTCYREMAELEPWLTGATSVPEIAVLFSLETQRLFAWCAAELPSGHYVKSLQGAVKMLLLGNRHFDVVDEQMLRRDIQQYRVLLLPDAACLEEATIPLIREFVRQGGKLVASNFTSLYTSEGKMADNFALADVLGVNYEKVGDYSVDYLYDFDPAIGGGLPDMPLLLKQAGSRALNVSLTGDAVQLASLVEPAFEASLARHVYHQHAHPARRTAFPSIVRHSYGKGESLYFAGRMFVSFMHTHSPWLLKIMMNSLDYLDNDALLKVEAPASVQVYLLKQPGRYILHLVNINDAKLDVSGSFMERMIPVHNVKVRARIPAVQVYTAPDRKVVACADWQEGVEFRIDQVDVRQVVVLEVDERGSV